MDQAVKLFFVYIALGLSMCAPAFFPHFVASYLMIIFSEVRMMWISKLKMTLSTSLQLLFPLYVPSISQVSDGSGNCELFLLRNKKGFDRYGG